MAEEIRLERAEDAAAVRAVLAAAFGQEGEADLVEALRARGALDVALVAEDGRTVVGHIAFSPVEVERNPERVSVSGLGPVGVVPERHGEGIGARLCSEGLERCRRRGIGVVVVLGDPGYYSRFGFRRADEVGLRCEFDAPPEAFMALALADGALDRLEGVVSYHRAFRDV